jgi:AcrR family transcriptional regulator
LARSTSVTGIATSSIFQSIRHGIPEPDGAAVPAARTNRDGGAQGALSWRAARTRQLILDASRQLFLDRGYAGTRINNITDACQISRAGFYTYFQDKRAVFNALGESAYRDVVAAVRLWDEMARSCSRADVEQWVQRYFELMDDHGAFILSGARQLVHRLQLLGQLLRHQPGGERPVGDFPQPWRRAPGGRAR